jgi:hypothetical protein
LVKRPFFTYKWRKKWRVSHQWQFRPPDQDGRQRAERSHSLQNKKETVYTQSFLSAVFPMCVPSLSWQNDRFYITTRRGQPVARFVF